MLLFRKVQEDFLGVITFGTGPVSQSEPLTQHVDDICHPDFLCNNNTSNQAPVSRHWPNYTHSYPQLFKENAIWHIQLQSLVHHSFANFLIGQWSHDIHLTVDPMPTQYTSLNSPRLKLTLRALFVKQMVHRCDVYGRRPILLVSTTTNTSRAQANRLTH